MHIESPSGEIVHELNLTDDEVYFILRYADRLGYDKAIERLSPDPVWVKVRHWFIRIDGWESSHLAQWDKGAPAFEWRDSETNEILSPTPINCFGGFLTINDPGIEIALENIRPRWGFLCLTRTYGNKPLDKLYWSPNGTPNYDGVLFFWTSKNIPGNYLKHLNSEERKPLRFLERAIIVFTVTSLYALIYLCVSLWKGEYLISLAIAVLTLLHLWFLRIRISQHVTERERGESSNPQQ